MAYSQRDPAWANVTLGFDSSDPNSKDYGTIAMYGCYVTAIANVCNWAGNDLNPVQINDICKQNGWFVNGDQIGRDDIPALLCSNLGFVGRTNWSGPTDINFFDDASDPNISYIIEIDSSHAPGIQTHFVMVWAKPDASDLTIDDSWDGIRKPLSRYGSPPIVIQSAMKFVKVSSATPATPPLPLYTVEQITPKLVKTNKDPTNKWGLNWEFDYMSTHPLAQLPMGTVMTAVALVHHKDGYDYYRMAADDPDGFNILDCDDYTPPPPPSPTVITAPVTASNTQQYSLVRGLPYYPSPGNAANRTNSTGTLPNGAYYINSQKQGMYSLTKVLGQPQGTWINPADNTVTPPSPVVTTADIMKTWQWGYPTHEPVEYKVLHDLQVKDLVHGGQPIWIRAGKNVDIYGSFMKDDRTYLRPLTSVDDKGMYYWYGIETTNVHTGAPHLENEYDVTDVLISKWESFYDKAVKTIEGIFKPKRRK